MVSKRAARYLRIVLLLVVGASVSWGLCVWTHESYDPLRLKRWDAYLMFEPNILTYCFVPLGTSEGELLDAFGSPEAVLRQADGSYTRHTESRALPSQGWDVPKSSATDKCFVYFESDGVDMVEIYYFLSDNGRLVETFVSEGP